jgi:hypothetical protein
MKVILTAPLFVIYARGSKSMSVSEMEQIGYESAMSEVSDMIKNALKNEQLDKLPASMALRVLLASIKMSVDEEL